MGKVDDDLPDPLASPGSGASQSADELLAQLASSEVDRLLAEAELERPVKADALDRVDAETAKQLDKLFDERQSGGGRGAPVPVVQKVEAAPVTAAADGAADPNLNAQLSDLFTQLTGPDGSAGASTGVLFADADDATGEAERQVLASELLEAAGALADEEDGDGVEEPEAVPWYLKPLEWLNAPLAGCSDRAREVMGKVAIVTLVNALAVLIYVVLVRRR